MSAESAEMLTLATLLTKFIQTGSTCCLAAKEQKPVDIHRGKKNVYGETCLLKTTVVEGCSKLRAGRDSIQDASQSGRPSISNRNNNKRYIS